MKGLSEGYKRDIDQKWGSIANIGFFARKPRFRAPKKHPLLDSNHVLGTTGKSCANKKVLFSQIDISLSFTKFRVFFRKRKNEFLAKITLFGNK